MSNNQPKFAKVMTEEFRVSFPQVFEPKAFEGQEPKYSVVMLFDKKKDLSKLKELIKNAVELKWPDPTKRPKGLRNPLRDGDVEKPDMDGYAGCMFATASSKQRPGVVDQSVNPIINAEDFYPGCYARATVTAYAYDKAGNRGVALGLQNIQKLRDGESFGGRSKAENDFSPVAAADDFNPAPATGKAAAASDDMFS